MLKMNLTIVIQLLQLDCYTFFSKLVHQFLTDYFISPEGLQGKLFHICAGMEGRRN
jgi:hypothetical protein